VKHDLTKYLPVDLPHRAPPHHTPPRHATAAAGWHSAQIQQMGKMHRAEMDRRASLHLIIYDVLLN
jgi:hypothetical protein